MACGKIMLNITQISCLNNAQPAHEQQVKAVSCWTRQIKQDHITVGAVLSKLYRQPVQSWRTAETKPSACAPHRHEPAI